MEVRNYKHQIVLAQDLQPNKMYAIYIPEGEIPEVKSGAWIVNYKSKINKLNIIYNITRYDKNCLNISYYSYSTDMNLGTRATIVSNDFKFRVLTGTQSTKMLQAVRDSLKKNLYQQVYSQYMVGSDPEIFAETENQILPAFNFLDDKNKTKKTIKNVNKYTKLYSDGFAIEFETQAETCLAYHVDSIQFGLKRALEELKFKDKTAKLTIKNSLPIPPEVMAKATDEQIAFGCMPSRNIYGLAGETTNPRELPFRFAGGHIHFGCGQKTEAEVEKMVKTLDKILGVACVGLFQKLDNPLRRKYYGLPGEYRLPPHGLEYRVLSNGWMCHPLVTNLVFDLARKIVSMANRNLDYLWDATQEETIHTILNCDIDKAKEILNRNKDILLQLFKASYRFSTDEQLNIIFNACLNGVETLVKDVDDVEKNWDLTKNWLTHCENIDKNWVKGSVTLTTGKKV